MKYLTNSSKLLKILLLTGAALFATASVQAQEAKIGFLNTQRLVAEGMPYKNLAAKLEQEFSKRQRDLQDMDMRLKGMQDKYEKDAPILSDADRARRQREFSDQAKEFQRKQREFQEDVNQRKNEEMAAIGDRVVKVITSIADAEKYDIVIQDTSGIPYHSARIDITDKVLKVLNK